MANWSKNRKSGSAAFVSDITASSESAVGEDQSLHCDATTRRVVAVTSRIMFCFATGRQFTAAASLIIAIITIGRPSSAFLYRNNRITLPPPPPPPYRNSQKNTGSGGSPALGNYWGGSNVDLSGADLRQEWTSSPYCRNGVDSHEAYVRKVSGTYGASKVRY